jgi:SAM-dependent methyltransferase
MTESTCPACHGDRFRDFPARGGLRLLRCLSCASCRLSQGGGNGNGRLPAFHYDAEYFESWNLAPGSPAWRARAATAAMRLDTLERLGVRSGALLDVGAAGGYLVERAIRGGFDARGVEISEHAVEIASRVVPGRVHQGTLETVALEAGSLDVVTLFDVLEHLPDPEGALARLTGWLKPGGRLAVTTPDVDSLTARLMAGAWPHYKEEHLFYPSRRGLRMLLRSAGLEIEHEERAMKYLSVAFVAPLFTRYPVPVITPGMELLNRLLPASLREASFRVSIGERLLVGRKA